MASVAAYVLERLRQWGVHRVYGYPGDGIDGLYEEGQARCVEIDIDGSLTGVRYPNDVSLVGDARTTLRAMIPGLQRKTDRSWRALIEGEIATWRRVRDDRAHQPGDPLNPQYVFWELNRRLPERCISTSDSGSATNWYAIAAKFAFPDRPVIGFTVSYEQRVLSADPKNPATQKIPPLPPHVRREMLKETLKGLAQGDEDAVGIATKGFRGKWTEVAEHARNLLPGGRA